MLVIALTGGIGSGKSSVSQRLDELGIPVIDADIIAREQVLPGSAALREIETEFGSRVIQQDGSLDRAQLRTLIFNVPEKRQRLEQILHPRIRREMEHRLKLLDAPYAILVIPLLLETGQNELADRVLVVDCPEDQQIARVQRRDGLNDAQMKQILAAQVDRATRLSRADDVINNSGSLSELIAAVDKQHRSYLHLAKINQ
ncbi:MAG: dephospho-CoA kinase [Pseudomonadota bacterium]